MASQPVPSGKIDKESMDDIKAAFNYLEPLLVCGEGFKKLKIKKHKVKSETKDVKPSETEEKYTEEKIISIMTSTRDFFCHLCFYKEDIFVKMMFNIWHLYKVFGVDLLGDEAWKRVERDKSGLKKEPTESDKTSLEYSLSKQLSLQRTLFKKTKQNVSKVEYFYFDENADYNNPAKINTVNVVDINEDLKTIIEDGSWWEKTDTNDENAIEKICYCLGYYLHQLFKSLNNEYNEWKTNTESFVTYEGKILEFIKFQLPTNATNENTAADIRDKFILLDPLIQCAALLKRYRTWKKSDKKIIGLIIISTRNVLCQGVNDEIFNKMMLNIWHLYKVFGVDFIGNKIKAKAASAEGTLKEGKGNQKKIFDKILNRNKALNKDKYFYFKGFQDFFKNVKCEEETVADIDAKLKKIIKDAESQLKENEPLNEIQKKCWFFGYHLHYLVATRDCSWKKHTKMFTVKSDKFLQQIAEDMASKIK